MATKPPITGSGFGPADHTRLVKFIMDHPTELKRIITSKLHDRKPSVIQVIQASLSLQQEDTETEMSIRKFLALYPSIQKLRDRIGPRNNQFATKLEQIIDGAQSVKDLIHVLEEAKLSKEFQQKPIDIGIQVAIDILEDGIDTI